MRPVSTFARVALLGVTLGASSCSKSATELVVAVDSDYDVPAALAAVHAVIHSDMGPAIRDQTSFKLVGKDSPTDSQHFRLPLSFGVTFRDGGPSQAITVEVSAVASDGTSRFTRRAVTHFIEGRRLLLSMFLAKDCEGRTCQAGETCDRSGCVSEEIDPTTLPSVDPHKELGSGPGPSPDAGLPETGPSTADASDAGATSPAPDAGEDRPPLMVSPASGLQVSEVGRTARLSLRLAAAPSAPVTIELSSTDPTAGVVVPTTMVFTAADWNSVKTATISGVNDRRLTGDRSFSVVLDGAQRSIQVSAIVTDDGPVIAQAIPGAHGASQVALSADGMHLAFASTASDLVAADTNNQADVFVWDRSSGAITRVSVSSDGVESQSDSELGGISSDGRYVVFSSSGVLAAGASSGSGSSVYLHDRMTDQTTLVESNYVSSSWISPNARFILDYSEDGDAVRLYDRATGMGTSLASSVGDAEPRISADGRILAYRYGGIWMIDRGFTSPHMVQVQAPVSGATYGTLAVTPDGRFIVWGCTLGATVYTVATGAAEIVSADIHGKAADGEGVSMSDDGRLVMFTSPANDLIPGDRDGRTDLFGRDRTAAQTRRIATNVLPGQSALSADGRFIVYIDGSSSHAPSMVSW